MEPSFKQIADLFGISLPDEAQVEALGPRKIRGDNAEESAELGGQSLNEGDFAKAIEHFKRAIEQRDPTDSKGWLDLGAAYETADMAPQALRQYQKALRTAKEAEPEVGLSQLYKRQGKWRESMEHLRHALEREPHNAFLHFKMAELFRETGDKASALFSAQSAVANAPADSFYHYWIGDLLIEQKKYEEALDSLRAAIELSPGDDFLYLRTAAAFWGSNRKQEAVKAVRLASDLDPEKHLYHGVLELFLSEMGLDEEADLEAERSAKMDDYDRDILRRFAEEVGLVV